MIPTTITDNAVKQNNAEVLKTQIAEKPKPIVPPKNDGDIVDDEKELKLKFFSGNIEKFKTSNKQLEKLEVSNNNSVPSLGIIRPDVKNWHKAKTVKRLYNFAARIYKVLPELDGIKPKKLSTLRHNMENEVAVDSKTKQIVNSIDYVYSSLLAELAIALSISGPDTAETVLEFWYGEDKKKTYVDRGIEEEKTTFASVNRNGILELIMPYMIESVSLPSHDFQTEETLFGNRKHSFISNEIDGYSFTITASETSDGYIARLLEFLNATQIDPSTGLAWPPFFQQGLGLEIAVFDDYNIDYDENSSIKPNQAIKVARLLYTYLAEEITFTGHSAPHLSHSNDEVLYSLNFKAKYITFIAARDSADNISNAHEPAKTQKRKDTAGAYHGGQGRL